jgi:HlyD family secretion protein
MKSKPYFHQWFSGTLLIILIFISSCSRNHDNADAYGNFEADEVIVSAQSQGILLNLDVLEGDTVKKDQVIGKVDTTTPYIRHNQLLAQQTVINARLNNLEAQLNVQEEQRINLVREVNRMEKLLEEKAATPQQYDEISGKLKVLDSQTEAIRSQRNIILGEQAVLNAQLDEARNLLDKCIITSPLTGTILEKYAETGELVTPGKALFKVANISEMELKVFVSGAQLPAIALGDTVIIMIDSRDDTLQTMQGSVSWISSQVEFTPKIIQTREERINMVYAVKLRVKNDGRLKIGMPGEVKFSNR